MDKTGQYKKAILEALEKSLGVVTTACETVGISRSSYYNWYKEDQEFAKQVDELQLVALDFVESQLFKQIREGSTAATIFYLKTKGRSRGYIERIEESFKNGQNQQFNFKDIHIVINQILEQFSAIPEERLEQIAKPYRNKH